MPEPNTNKWLGQLRHVITMVGAVLTTFGYMTPEDVSSVMEGYDKIAGPALIILGQVWSWIAPEKKA